MKWQREQGVRGNWQSSTSPFGSPLRRRPQNLSLDNLADDLKGNLTVSERNQILDPTAILEVERHAKYLVLEEMGFFLSFVLLNKLNCILGHICR